MKDNASIPRSSKVRVLGSIALLLFCLNLLLFVDRHVLQVHAVGSMAEPAFLHPEQRPAVEHRGMEKNAGAALMVNPAPQAERPVPANQELRIRAAQSPETDLVLRNRLGLQQAGPINIPIMR